MKNKPNLGRNFSVVIGIEFSKHAFSEFFQYFLVEGIGRSSKEWVRRVKKRMVEEVKGEADAEVQKKYKRKKSAEVQKCRRIRRRVRGSEVKGEVKGG